MPVAATYFAHPTADIEPGAVIGEGTKFWHQCHVRKGAEIGELCVLAKGVFIDRDVRIGNCVKIQNHVSVFHGVTIEDGVFIGPHACFTNDLYPRAVHPDMSPKTGGDWPVEKTLVEKGSSIGANATIVCGVRIGQWAMVGAGSLVKEDVPAHALVVGNPARIIGYVCRCGKKCPSLADATSCHHAE